MCGGPATNEKRKKPPHKQFNSIQFGPNQSVPFFVAIAVVESHLCVGRQLQIQHCVGGDRSPNKPATSQLLLELFCFHLIDDIIYYSQPSSQMSSVCRSAGLKLCCLLASNLGSPKSRAAPAPTLLIGCNISKQMNERNKLFTAAAGRHVFLPAEAA